MDAIEYVPSEAELAAFKRLGIDLAEQDARPAIAQAFRIGGSEQVVRSLSALTFEEKRKAIGLFLASISLDETLPVALAKVAEFGALGIVDQLPTIVDGAETFVFAEMLDRSLSDIRAAGYASGRERKVRFVEYASYVCATVRLSEMKVGGLPFTARNGHLFKNVIMSLVCYPTFQVVKDVLAQPSGLKEAFALALAGYAPIQQRGNGWIARRLVG